MDISAIILLVMIALTVVYLMLNVMKDTFDPLVYTRPDNRKCQRIQSRLQRVRQQLKTLEVQEGHSCTFLGDPAAPGNQPTPVDAGEYVGKSLVEVRPLLKEKYPTKTIEERKEGMVYAAVVKPDTIFVYYKQLEIPANVRAVPGTFTEVTRVVIQPPSSLPPSAVESLPYTVRPIHWNGGRPSGGVQNMPFAVKPIMHGREKTNWMPRRRGGRRGGRNRYQVTNWM